MFSIFRFRYWLSPLQKLELTGRWFSDCVGFWNGVALRRGLVIGFLAIALWCGTAIPAPVAHAAATPEAEAYDAGPIRQTRNPLSGENFQGGVDDSALEKTESRRQPEDDDKGLLETLKDKVTGNAAQEAPADLKTERNPTLERYPQSLD